MDEELATVGYLGAAAATSDIIAVTTADGRGGSDHHDIHVIIASPTYLVPGNPVLYPSIEGDTVYSQGGAVTIDLGILTTGGVPNVPVSLYEPSTPEFMIALEYTDDHGYPDGPISDPITIPQIIGVGGDIDPPYSTYLSPGFLYYHITSYSRTTEDVQLIFAPEANNFLYYEFSGNDTNYTYEASQGEPFSSYEYTYSDDDQLINASFTNADGSTYFSYSDAANVTAYNSFRLALDNIPGGFNINDTAFNIGNDFNALEVDVSNIQSISFSDAGTPLLDLTDAQVINDSALLAKIDSPYVLVVTCYVRGTLILTEKGEVAVEKLAIGDRLVTASGEAKPIKWIGRRSLDCLRRRDPESAWPICVSADAFSARKPSRDLWLSPGHNIAVEGMLMPIRVLQNGRTVVQHQCQTVEYWHVELESHDIIIANGLPAESYLDTGNRTAFVNGGAFIEAFPDFKPKHWAETCLPLVFEGAEVTRAKARLLERLKGFGHVKTSDADLHVMADGKRIDPLECGAMQYAFALPTGQMDIRLVSRTFIPAHTLAESTDTRSLGICVGRLQIGFDAVALDSETLVATEWHEAEPGLRWTRGNVTLPPKTRLVVIDLAGPGHYWQERRDNVVSLFGYGSNVVRCTE